MANFTRRDAMIALGAVAGSGFVTAAVTPLGEALGGILRDKAEKILDPFDYDLEAIKGVFGPIDVRSSFVPGQSHPNPKYPGFHPDDEYIADRFDELVRDTVENRVVYDSSRIPQNLKGTVIASGSPVSNALARRLLQYDFVNPSDRMAGLARAENPIFDLDFEFILSRASLDGLGVSSPVGRSGETGNWSIHKKSSHDLYASEVKEEKIDSDYLLVTCLPNVYDEESLANGENIYLLAGGHGVGTKGADLLLKDSAILARVQREVGHSLYWQALFKIEGVDHFYNDPKYGVRWHPRRLAAGFEVSTVSFNEDRLRELLL